MSEKSGWAKAIVNHLVRLANSDNPDRATLAHLRRGLSQSMDATLALVGWIFKPALDNERHLKAAILTAGLFAWDKGRCPHTEKDVNFGAAFGSGLGSDDRERRSRRFKVLLDTDVEELPFKLRQALSLMGSQGGMSLNWVNLMLDITKWDHSDRIVQKSWAIGFWRQQAAEEESDNSSDEPVIV